MSEPTPDDIAAEAPYTPEEVVMVVTVYKRTLPSGRNIMGYERKMTDNEMTIQDAVMAAGSVASAASNLLVAMAGAMSGVPTDAPKEVTETPVALPKDNPDAKEFYG